MTKKRQKHSAEPAPTPAAEEAACNLQLMEAARDQSQTSLRSDVEEAVLVVVGLGRAVGDDEPVTQRFVDYFKEQVARATNALEEAASEIEDLANLTSEILAQQAFLEAEERAAQDLADEDQPEA